MIEVDRLTKRYGPVPAIQDVSFAVEKGQIVGFLGPNGAGKTTTMRILAGFMPASGGHRPGRRLRRVRAVAGGPAPDRLPAGERAALPGDAVEEYLASRRHQGTGRGERRRRVDDVMERCRIDDVRERLIGPLSKGYRQRVGLAEALIADPTC